MFRVISEALDAERRRKKGTAIRAAQIRTPGLGHQSNRQSKEHPSALQVTVARCAHRTATRQSTSFSATRYSKSLLTPTWERKFLAGSLVLPTGEPAGSAFEGLDEV